MSKVKQENIAIDVDGQAKIVIGVKGQEKRI